MSFSDHRPGRLGSQGHIEFDVDATVTEPLSFTPTFIPDATGSDDAETEPATETTTVTEPYPDDLLDTELLDALGRAPEPAVEPTVEPAAQTPVPQQPARRRRVRVEPAMQVYTERRPLRRLAILGGADGHVLDEVPTETSRFVQMFFVLAGTALVSAISMLFALTTGVRISAWAAAPLAIVWALIIFNLDRFLTSTMKATRNIAKLLGLALPRVVMAAIIGVVVAEPLVLQVFHNDVQREVASTNIAQAQQDQQALASGPEKLALDAASQRVSELENQAVTGAVAGTEAQTATEQAAQSTVDTLTSQVADQQQVIEQARALYQCELTGEGADTVEGCTGVNGQGASSDAAQQQLAQAQTDYNALAKQLATAQEALKEASDGSRAVASASEETNRQQAQDQLPAAQQAYQSALDDYNSRAADVAGGNAAAEGLLSQITALNSLSEKEPTLAWAHWLIAALFFMIELLPVLVKVMLSYGDKSLYEEADDARRLVASDRVKARAWRDRAAISVQTVQ